MADAQSNHSTWDAPMLLVGGLICLIIFILLQATLHLPSTQEEAWSLVLIGLGLLCLYLFPRQRLAAMFIATASSLRYFWWRSTETIYKDGFPYLTHEGSWIWDWRHAPDSLLSICLLLAEFYALYILFGGFFQTAVHQERTPIPVDFNDPKLPTVDIFVPSYNEHIDILRRTLTGAMNIQYPKKRVFLLDDTRVEESDHPNNPKALESHRRMRVEREALAQEMGFTLISRKDHSHAKAGNINHALAQTSGELIAIFDADHIPVSSFLQTTVGFFRDAKLSLVQTPHHFYNADPFERNLYMEGKAPSEQMLFYHLIQKSNDFWNSAFFCGSCAVLRRTALMEVGGIATETVTEDAHTSLKMHAAGWRSVYLDLPQAAGLATESFAAHITQRSRWAIGMTQIMREDFPLLKRGLSLAQRINYTIAATHFQFGPPRIMYLIAPIAYLLLGLHPLVCSARDFVVFAGPHLALSLATASVSNRNARHSFWPEVHETALAVWTSYVTIRTFLGDRFRFQVTDKGISHQHHTFDWRSAGPVLVFWAFAITSMLLCPYFVVSRPDEFDTIMIAEAWNAYNLLLLGAAIAVAYERPERRTTVRLAVQARGKIRNAPLTIQALPVVPVEVALLPDPEEEDDDDISDADLVRSADISPGIYPPPDMEVVIEDLSEGGARLRFPEEQELPERFTCNITTLDGQPLSIDVRVQNRFTTKEGMVVGVCFDALTEAQRRGVIRIMFTDPQRWLHARFDQDNLIISALRVFYAPLFSIFLFRWLDNSRAESGTSLVSSAGRLPICAECHSTLRMDSLDCPACGTPVPLTNTTLLSNLPKPGIYMLLGGVFALLLGIGLDRGWWSWKDEIDQQAFINNGHSYAELSRLEELRSAHAELRALTWQAYAATMPLSRGLPGTWERHLWSIQYHFDLESPNPSPLELRLRDACNLLFDVQRGLLAHQAMDQIRAKVVAAHDILKNAESLLDDAPKTGEGS